MKLALLATMLTFAGSITGFAFATGVGAPARDVAKSPPAATTVDVVRVSDDCPRERAT